MISLIIVVVLLCMIISIYFIENNIKKPIYRCCLNSIIFIIILFIACKISISSSEAMDTSYNSRLCSEITYDFYKLSEEKKYDILNKRLKFLYENLPNVIGDSNKVVQLINYMEFKYPKY